jgi:hypothetical protein
MTIQDVAKSEGISKRQAQRYCREPGYQGHVLKATRLGRAFSIAIEDYRAWRVECGWDFLPQPEPQRAAEISQGEVIAPEPVDERPAYPPYPKAADPNGVLTNVPHEHSRNWPHPLAVRDFERERTRQNKAQLLGEENEN